MVNPYALDGKKNANAETLNAITGDIALRLTAIEGLQQDLELAKDTLVAIGLQRLNDELLPVIRTEQARVQRGVLIAASATPVTLVQDSTVNITVADEDRFSFSPSAFVSLTRTSTLHDYAILRTQNWNMDTGLYTGTITLVIGDPGPWNDWQLGSQAASAVAMLSLLTLAQSAQATAAASADAARADRLLADADAASTEADRLAIQQAITSGPVLKVLGMTGIITASQLKQALALTSADVSGVATANALAALLASSLQTARGLGEIAAQGARAQDRARRHIGSLSRGRIAALASTL